MVIGLRKWADARRTDAAIGRQPDKRLQIVTIGWFWLAAAALIYLATFSLFRTPDAGVATGTASSPDRSDAFKMVLSSSRARAAKADRTLTLAELEVKLQKLNTTVAGLQARNAALETEVEALNEALTTATGSITTQSKGPKRSRAPAGLTTVMQPLPRDGFGDEMLATSPIPIASVARPTRTLFAVELSKKGSVKALKADWKRLGERHGALLEGLQPRRAPNEGSTDKSAKLRLLAGPFPNAAEAARLCARLRARKARCTETVYVGKAL